MKSASQCQFAESAADQPRCIKTATRKYGDHWFCDEHGARGKPAPHHTKMRATLPATFNKLASSPTMEGLRKHITRFYGGEEKTLLPQDTPHRWDVMTASGRRLSTVVIQTTRGFYFGVDGEI